MKNLWIIGVIACVVLLAGALVLGAGKISANSDYDSGNSGNGGYYGCDSGCPNYQATGHGCTAQNNCGISTCGAVRAASNG